MIYDFADVYSPVLVLFSSDAFENLGVIWHGVIMEFLEWQRKKQIQHATNEIQ